jgi:hypothetical protein
MHWLQREKLNGKSKVTGKASTRDYRAWKAGFEMCGGR